MLTCPSCGRANPAEASFCMGCGGPLGAPVAAHETRKTVTALFCDLVGSTTLGETHDPEVLRPLLEGYFAAARSAVERHGGRVEKFIGDAISAVFGLPVVHEDDALRAVRAAFEIQQRLAVLAFGASFPFAARIGVTTGEVLVPGDGTPLIGDTMNTAARLQAAAEPGTVLLGEPTYRLVRDAITAEPVATLSLRGKAVPVAAFRLLGIVKGGEGHRRHLEAPMVGRERELEALVRAFQRTVSDGTCQLFTILGTAGVGKSRLVSEFLGGIRDRARIVRGHCLPYGDGITYWAVAEIVRQAAGIEDGDTAETARERIDAFVAGLPEAAAIARGLVNVIGLGGSAAQDELVWAFRRVLERLADERPLVVLVDDIHWAEPTLLDIIDSLADLARDSPILFVCMARPELLDDRPTWGGGKLNATTVLLEPLAEAPALELVDALVPGGALPPAVRARIADAAEGNPLYVEEFLGMLIDDGELVADGDGWVATRDLASIAVPPSIQALLSARLDSLGSDERAAAERASVVGRSFDQPAVVGISPPEGRSEVPRNLVALARKELIRRDRSGLVPGESFRFRHMLIRDAAYERLPKAERAELHALFAGWLEATAGDRLTEVEEMVGYHLEQAHRYRAELDPTGDRAPQLARRAALRLIAAGSRALDRSDVAATVNLYGRAATLLDLADPARLLILPDLAEALQALGRFDDAKVCLAEALERAETAGDEQAFARARVEQYLSGNAGADVPADDMRRVADECLSVFERLGDDRGLALAWRLRGLACWQEGNVAGDEVATARALDCARRAGSHWDQASIVFDLSVDFYFGPTPIRDAIKQCRDILESAPNDRGVEEPIAHALAHMHARLGEFELARSLAARCLEIATESGLHEHAAALNEVAADVETLAGNRAAAERMLARGCAWYVAMGKPHATLEALHALSRVAGGLSIDVERVTALAASEDRAPRALLAAALAGAHLNAGRQVEAERDARSAVAYFASTDMITFHADCLLILGDVLGAAGRREDASAEYQQALDLYRRKGSLVGIETAATRLAS